MKEGAGSRERKAGRRGMQIGKAVGRQPEEGQGEGGTKTGGK